MRQARMFVWCVLVGSVLAWGGEPTPFRQHQEPNPFIRFFVALAELPRQLIDFCSGEWQDGTQSMQTTLREFREDTREDAEATQENLDLIPDLLYRQVPEDEERLGGSMRELSGDLQGHWEESVDSFMWLWE